MWGDGQRSRNRVAPSGVKRVTAQEPTERQPGSMSGAVAPYRFNGVRRTRRKEPASRSQIGRDGPLIDPQQTQQDPSRQPAPRVIFFAIYNRGARGGALGRAHAAIKDANSWVKVSHDHA